ncbi:putative pentatricopeptide [Helianthus annuus]|nr:putative pentatricopeptide [Helianthus annuus]
MESYLVQTTSKIKSGRVTHAHKLFDEMPHRDMLTCYTHLDLYQEALLLFNQMTTPNLIITRLPQL